MQQRAVEEVRSKKEASWLGWLGRHPGLMVLGALLLAMVVLVGSTPPADQARDANGEDAPLFI